MRAFGKDSYLQSSGGRRTTRRLTLRRRARGRFARPRFLTAFVLLALLAAAGAAFADARGTTRRVVVLKVDGLPHDMVDRFVRERDVRTGKSLLPWIEHVFYERGTRLTNFYVRGMSLSGPSWSLLDTGQHLQVKGNVEFDRFTLHTYDYLNFIPFYLHHAAGLRVDMPGAEVLDEVGLPLLIDAYPYDERYQGFQLYQRGTRWTTLQRGLKNRFASRSPRELLDEWTAGFERRSIILEQLERELIEKLTDPRIRYLDLYSSDFDHAAHHNRDRATHLHALQDLDALVGRVWMAIQKTPLAAETALILLSDHGTNTDERVYSQGYNLVKLLGSAAGGGHHVITKRRLLNDYSIKGIYPLVPLIVTTTPESYYLRGQSTDYPTAIVDFDGNERAAIHLRNNDLNVLHMLWQQLQRRDLDPRLRRAATDAFFSTLDRRRRGWQATLSELTDELGALHRLIEKQRALVAAQPKKWTKEDQDAGRDQVARRLSAQLHSWLADERDYTAYLRTLTNLLALQRPRSENGESFAPPQLRLEDLIAKGTMGEHNTIEELQNYTIGLAPAGLSLRPDGSLDLEKSFVRVDYFALLSGLSVRNNVQQGVAHRPVDFVATRLSPADLHGEIPDEGLRRADEIIWLNAGPEAQALILARRDEAGTLLLRYLPVAHLRQESTGRLRFERAPWGPGQPLRIWEDERLRVAGGGSRAEWLSGWHSDLEWLRALHQTKYSNALVGLHEQLARHPAPAIDPEAPGLSTDERLLRRFRHRQRHLVETDLLVLANQHWNFDVRGFNPGGNHGSFFRVSTHATLMLAGGALTGVPRGFVIEEPYDSLSFVPTVLALTRQVSAEGRVPVPVLWQQGFRPFPGRIIEGILTPETKTGWPLANARPGVEEEAP